MFELITRRFSSTPFGFLDATDRPFFSMASGALGDGRLSSFKKLTVLVIAISVMLFSLGGCSDKTEVTAVTEEIKISADKVERFVAAVKPAISSWQDATMGCGVGSTQSCDNPAGIAKAKIDILSSMDLYPGHPTAELNLGWQIFNLYFHAYTELIKADLLMLEEGYDKSAMLTLLKDGTAHTATIFELIAEAKQIPKQLEWLERAKIESNAKLLNLMLYSLIYHAEPTLANKQNAYTALMLIGGEDEWKNYGLYNDRISKLVLNKERDVL